MKITVNYKKSIGDAVGEKLKELVKKNKLPNFDLWETIDEGNNNHKVVLRLENLKQCRTWVIKEFNSIIDHENKQVTLILE